MHGRAGYSIPREIKRQISALEFVTVLRFSVRIRLNLAVPNSED